MAPKSSGLYLLIREFQEKSYRKFEKILRDVSVALPQVAPDARFILGEKMLRCRRKKILRPPRYVQIPFEAQSTTYGANF